MKGRKTILWKQNSPFNSLLIYWNIGWPKLYLYNIKDCQDEIKIKVHFRPILNIVYTWRHVWCIICCFKNSTLYIPTAEQTGVIWVVFQRHTNVSFNKEENINRGSEWTLLSGSSRKVGSYIGNFPYWSRSSRPSYFSHRAKKGTI